MKSIDKEGGEWLVEMDILQPNIETTRTMKTAVEFILQVIGFTIMWYAVNYKRETKIISVSTLWFAIIGMMIIAGILIKTNI